MAFYAFSLDSLDVKFQRGKLQDLDVITFSVPVNQLVRAKAVGVGPGISGYPTYLEAVPIDKGTKVRSVRQAGWVAGPLDIAEGDQVTLVYSGTNISDTPWKLAAQQQDDIETKLLDAVVSAAVGAVGGEIAAAVGSVLGLIGDPVGKLLGIHHQGPCNGPVFSDSLSFAGSGLARLPFQPRNIPDLPEVTATGFARDYTDEATHDSSTCGHVAETTVHFSAYRLSSLSLRTWIPGANQGLRRLSTPPFGVRSLFQH
jgi:hypothetical protein